MVSADPKSRLAEARAAFRQRMEQAGAAKIFANFSGRTAAVLSGGGARGSYEVGALLAFQDAQLPTHIIASSSVGSMNAASFAAHSETTVGSAESLTETWFNLTPLSVGIEWTHYVWRLTGLVAAAAGFANLGRILLFPEGFDIHLHNPAITWLALGLVGIALSLFHDHLPYIGYLIRFRRKSWRMDRRKAGLSILANVIVWGFILIVLQSLHIHSRLREIVDDYPASAIGLLAGIALLILLRNFWGPPLGVLLHHLLRLPLRPGLFANFERGQLLRQNVSAGKLCASPIRLIFTATELESGTARFFSNTPPETLAADPGADPRFILDEVVETNDLMRAVIASSALPIVYEPISMNDHLYSDGGIVTNQPIRPAIRLGADVLFLIMVETHASRRRGDVRTFIDVGLRALDVLMLQGLLADLKLLGSVNSLCEQAAAEFQLRPEEIEIDFGARRYRYTRPFIIRPATPLGGTALDFGGVTTGNAILQGYLDASAQVEEFLAYAPQAKFGGHKRLLRFFPESRPSPGAQP